MKKLVSIIIPALNEEKVIKETLLSLKRQNYQPIEIIVVDNGSTDLTSQIAKKYADRVPYLPEKRANRARNFGAKIARGKYLVFLDADTKIEKNAVQNAVESLEKGYAGGMVKIVYESKSPKIKLIETVQNFCLAKWKIFFTPVIYTTKETFEKSGGWNESIEFWEIDLLKRISKFGEIKYDFDSAAKTSPRRFIKNKDYMYAVLGGALALYGVKNSPLYPIREVREKGNKEITSFLSKKLSLSPPKLRLLIDIINKNDFKGFITKKYKQFKNWRM